LSPGGGGAHYIFTTSAVSGGSYYRLRQINYDGLYSYSPVRFIKFDSNGLLKVYPNPVQQDMHIKTSITLNNAQMKIYNLQGKLILQKIISGNGIINVSVRSLPTGIYVAKINSGGKELRLTFIKE
ncbi:MAG: T9SS type A sorting domain-containing protein, partial [Bacteroidota bacterium]|nr:T9SS type A sorting domain-containing protein [Bacteroidota bacterium]